MELLPLLPLFITTMANVPDFIILLYLTPHDFIVKGRALRIK
jgi:hypothetical protein